MENINDINREHDPNYVNKLKESLHIKNNLTDWHDTTKEKPCTAIGYKSLSPKVEVKTPLGDGTGYYNCTDNDWLVELYGDITDELQAYKDVTHWRFIDNKLNKAMEIESKLTSIIAKHFKCPPDETTYNKIIAVAEDYLSEMIKDPQDPH
jgi:hypothetical protein